MGGTEGGEEGGEGEGTRGGRERRGRDRVRGGREEARMLHRHEASVGEGRVEGGRVDDGNKRGRNGARHGRREGGSERGRDCARKRWSKGARKLNFKGGILSIQYIHTQSRNALWPLLLCYYK